MPGGVPVPPMPSKLVLVVAGAVCVAAGLALLIRGRANGRVILAVFAAGGAASAAPIVVEWVPLKNVWLTGASAAVAAGLLAFVLGRVLWALVLAAVVGTAALALAGWLSADAIADRPAWSEAPAETFGAWCRDGRDYLGAWVVAIWRHKASTVALAAGLAAVALVVGLLLPRAALVLTSSAVGASAVVGGAGMLLWAGEVAYAARWLNRPLAPAAAAGAMALFGVAAQACSEFRRSRAAREAADEGPHEGDDRS